jgi:hypothetical protein
MSRAQVSGLLQNFPRLIRLASSVKCDPGRSMFWTLDTITSSAVQWLMEDRPGAVGTRNMPDFNAIFSNRCPSADNAGADIVQGSELVSLAGSLPLLARWEDLQSSMLLVEKLIMAAAPGRCRSSVLQHCHDLYVRSDDYSRKVQIAEWFQELMSRDQIIMKSQYRGELIKAHQIQLA